MNLNIHYQKPYEQPYTTSCILHKNNKGFHINIEGKYYFPNPNNPVIQFPDKYEDKELWVVIIKDRVSYGNFAFAPPDYFVKEKEDSTEVSIEKEIPCNHLDREENIYEWVYPIVATIKHPDESEKFIDICEDKGVPDSVVKEALSLFYQKFNNQ